jgi:hypothetical protein
MRRIATLAACLALAACGAARVPSGSGGAVAASAASGSAVTPACGVSDTALGSAIGSASGYTVHDTAPGSTEPRTHHVTGFSDGCPRAVTAALVLFGDVATYETVHYAAHAEDRAATDLAYEDIKARVCGTPRGQPCGDRLPRLAQDTVFLSLYPVFGAEEHRDLLLHAGEVAAVDG